MSKHTPGPWVAIFPSERQFYEGRDITNFDVMTEKTRADLRDEGFHHYRADPGRVDNISIVSMNFWGDMRDEEAKANARLIAAAPELLEALINALHLIEIAVPVEGKTVRMARAAIAKATGETK